VEPLIAEAMDMSRYVPLAAFGAAAVVVWLMLERLAAEKPRAERRLDELREPGKHRDGRDRSGKKSDAMSNLLEKASPAFAKPLTPKTELEMSRLKLRLTHAGFRSEAAPSVYLGLKFVGLLGGFFIGGGTMILTKGVGMDALMWTVGIAGILFYFPDAALWLIKRKRQENIFLGLPDALDLMVVCVEAGLGLDQAMRKVAEEMAETYRVIAEEFGLCNFQLQMGRARNEVLHELGYRTGVEDLRALSAILIQADKFGSSIAQALRVQSDSMRVRRRQLAEERAAKTAVKLIFPLVLFIFPAIFVVLVGPAAITMINEMFPAMSGGG